MSLTNDIMFSILCRKTKLNEKQEQFVCNRIIKGRTPIEDLSRLHVRARAGEICTCAYLRQTREELANKIVCELTPTRAVRQITNEEFLLDLIATNYEHFDDINHELLRSKHYETYLKVVVAYCNAVECEILNYNNKLYPTTSDTRRYNENLGRQQLYAEDYENAQVELARINNQRETARLEREKFAEEQADFILGIAEEVRNERDGVTPPSDGGISEM